MIGITKPLLTMTGGKCVEEAGEVETEEIATESEWSLKAFFPTRKVRLAQGFFC